MITASRIELVSRCEGHLTRRHADSPNEWSKGGNERHAEDESAIGSGVIPEVYLRRWPGLSWRAEVSYAYDAASDTGRFLGVGINRNYGEMRPFEIAGTIDAEGRAPGVLVIVDKKSFEAVTPAARNPQVRFLALAASRADPASRVEVAISHMISGMDTAEIDDLELDIIAQSVRDLLVRAANPRPIFNTGRWCRWCPAFDDCPEQRTLLAAATGDAALFSELNEETAASIYELHSRIKILSKRLGERLYAYASDRPIKLGGGKVFGPHAVLSNEKLNGDIVYEVAKSLYGQTFADLATSRNASKASIKRAVAELGIPKAEKQMMDEVRKKDGVVSRVSTIKIEEHNE